MKRAQLIGWSAAALLGAVLLGGLVLLWLLPERGANISETMLVVNDVDGAGFDVVCTNSDTLAKQEWVNVYVYATGSRSNRLGRLIHSRKLLFSCDPGYPAEVPRIVAVGPQHDSDFAGPSLIHPLSRPSLERIIRGLSDQKD